MRMWDGEGWLREGEMEGMGDGEGKKEMREGWGRGMGDINFSPPTPPIPPLHRENTARARERKLGNLDFSMFFFFTNFYCPVLWLSYPVLYLRLLSLRVCVEPFSLFYFIRWDGMGEMGREGEMDGKLLFKATGGKWEGMGWGDGMGGWERGWGKHAGWGC